MVMTWLTVVLVLASVVILAMAWRRGSGTVPETDAVLVAHTAEIRRSRRFRSRANWLRLALTVGLVLASACAVIAAYLAGRPVDVVARNEHLASRDIVMCLDISGSVIEFDGEIIDSFEALLPDFSGERIAMVVWNAGARTVFPLTDDYDMIAEQFANARKSLTVFGTGAGLVPADIDAYKRFSAGTELGGEYGSSLVGDGLASCLSVFDMADDERSRFVILATDNDVAGNPVYTLDEAAELAQARGITIHGLRIEPAGWGSTPGVGEAMERSITDHGGYFYEATDAAAAQSIVARVQSQDAVDLGATSDVVRTDDPKGWPIVLGALVIALIGLAWRLRV